MFTMEELDTIDGIVKELVETHQEVRITGDKFTMIVAGEDGEVKVRFIDFRMGRGLYVSNPNVYILLERRDQTLEDLLPRDLFEPLLNDIENWGVFDVFKEDLLLRVTFGNHPK